MENSYKPKVLLVHNFYQVPGGEDTVFDNEKKMLEENGHEVITYTRDNKEMNEFNIFEKLCYPINTVFSLKTYYEVKKIILNKQIDIVHVHNTWPLISPSIYYAAFHSKIPIVQTIHNFRMNCPSGTLYHNGAICEDSLYKGLFSSLKLKIYKGSFTHTLISVCTLKVHRLLKTYNRVNFIFLTEFNKNKILELNNYNKYQIIDENRTFVKPNFVENSNNIVSYDKRANQFIFVGRLDKLKGINLLLEAWKEVKESKLIICGTGPEEEWCKAYIKENNLTNIEMMGFISNIRAKDIISNSKALILPSQWYEGFPMTLVESLACGTPIIGSDIGNVGDLIENGVTGLKFQYNSVEDLRNKVHVLTDMVESSKMKYEYNYSPRLNYLELVTIYSKLK